MVVVGEFQSPDATREYCTAALVTNLARQHVELESMELLAGTFTAIGVGLCIPLLLVLLAWTWQAWTHARLVRRQFLAWQMGMRRELDERDAQSHSKSGAASESIPGWAGWRKFRVSELQPQTGRAQRIWLQPVDGKPVAGFRPGQYLTVRLQTGPRNKPLVRCYSISGPIESNRYELTVKHVTRHGGEGKQDSASLWIHSELMVGDEMEVKAPGGDFFLDESANTPVVLLAAGVGITPMAGMISRLVAIRSPRRIVLLYGNRNSADHVFRKELAETAARHPALTVVNFYSAPLETDRLGEDFQVQGHVSIEVIRRILPDRKFQFYLCGPAGFMKSLHEGLLDWGVPAQRIRKEAFGPASVPRSQISEHAAGSKQSEKSVPVNFRRSDRLAECIVQEKSILELAESISVEIASGCRAGSCGSCAIRLLNGKVKYGEAPSAAIEPGFCLACIAQPDGPVEVEA